MILYPTVSSFFFVLCFSVFFILSSSSWFGVWLGLELNMISFIVLMMSGAKTSSSEASIKYFLLQALGSGLFFLGFVIFYMLTGAWSVCFLDLNFSSFLILSGLGIKLGLAPFHFWVPSVMNALSWSNAMILSTVQKIGPLVFFIYFNSMMSITLILGVFGVIVGGLGGLNQTQIRSLLGYSSISHMGWMVAIGSISLYYSFFYLGIYLMSTLIVFWSLMLMMNNNSIKTPNLTKMESLMFYCTLLSLGGLPPLLGFFPKMLAFELLSNYNLYLILFLLIMGSLMSLFYYLSLFFNYYINNYIGFKQNLFMNPMSISNLIFLVFVSILFFSGMLILELF